MDIVEYNDLNIRYEGNRSYPYVIVVDGGDFWSAHHMDLGGLYFLSNDYFMDFMIFGNGTPFRFVHGHH